MQTLLKTGLAIAAVAALSACGGSDQEAPEPQNENVAAEMPQTPDMGGAADAAAQGQATGAPAAPATTETPPAQPAPEPTG
jgi:hypothetical protein